MKKSVIFSLLMGAVALTGSAQTDFRHISFDEGLKAARKENKLLFVDFYTDWCGPCKKMANEVFPQENVGKYMNENFVSLKLNAEQEGADLSKKYGVAAFPTFIIVDGKGNLVTKVTGYRPGDEFVAKLKSALDPDQAPGKIRDRYLAGERTPNVVNGYVMSLLEAKKEEEAMKAVEQYYKSLSDADRLKPENSFIFTRYTTDLDSNRGRFMVENRDKFDSSVRGAVIDRLGQLYDNQLVQYFSGYIYREGKYNKDKFGKLKNDINALGINKDKKYDVIFDFVEKRAGSDDTEFLAYCESHYNDLDTRNKTILVMNMLRLIQDRKAYPALSKFLRSRVGNMSPTEIQFSGRILGNIEQ